MEDKCPFCGALKSPYQSSPIFTEYDCGTSRYGPAGSVDYTRKDTCYLSEIIDQQTQLDECLEMVRKQSEALDCLCACNCTCDTEPMECPRCKSPINTDYYPKKCPVCTAQEVSTKAAALVKRLVEKEGK